MNLDIPHMIATMIVIFAVVWGLSQLAVVENMTKLRRALVTMASLFVAIFILNIFWPYG